LTKQETFKKVLHLKELSRTIDILESKHSYQLLIKSNSISI